MHSPGLHQILEFTIVERYRDRKQQKIHIVHVTAPSFFSKSIRNIHRLCLNVDDVEDMGGGWGMKSTTRRHHPLWWLPEVVVRFNVLSHELSTQKKSS